MSLISVLALIGAVVFITHALEAVTGFGCTVLAMPFVIAITGDIGLSKIILSILAWALALYIAAIHRKQIDWRQFGIILAVALPGLPVGIFVFQSLDPHLLTRLLGGFMILSAGVQLYKTYARGTVISPRFSRWNYLYLLAGGVVHGAFATGGPLIVLYSAKTLPDKARFRATMCLLWACLNTLLMIQYARDGVLTKAVGMDLLFLFPFLAAGIVAGEFVHNRVNEPLFRKIVFLMLLAVGIVMVIL